MSTSVWSLSRDSYHFFLLIRRLCLLKPHPRRLLGVSDFSFGEIVRDKGSGEPESLLLIYLIYYFDIVMLKESRLFRSFYQSNSHYRVFTEVGHAWLSCRQKVVHVAKS